MAFIYQKKVTITALAQKFNVSRPTIYKTLKLSRYKLFRLQLSINESYKILKYGIKRLVKVEKTIEERLKRQAKRYNKSYLGAMFHVDTKCLSLLRGETTLSRREYLFVGVDDYSRELYEEFVAINPNLVQTFLQNDVLAQTPYTSFCVYSDNGRKYQGKLEHTFVALCRQNHINQKFTKPLASKLMAKQSVLLERSWKCGMNERHLPMLMIGKPNLGDLLISTIPLNHIKV